VQSCTCTGDLTARTYAAALQLANAWPTSTLNLHHMGICSAELGHAHCQSHTFESLQPHIRAANLARMWSLKTRAESDGQ
jgi:hypothetical protein